jgi:hypothetical protein
MLLKSILICGYPPRHHHYRANPIFFACCVSTIVQNKHQYGPTAALGGRILHFKTYTQHAVADGTIPDDVSKLLLLWMTPSCLRPKKKPLKRKINMSYRVNTNSTYTVSVQHVSSTCIASDCIPELLCSNVDINHETHSEGSIFDFRPHDRLA